MASWGSIVGYLSKISGPEFLRHIAPALRSSIGATSLHIIQTFKVYWVSPYRSPSFTDNLQPEAATLLSLKAYVGVLNADWLSSVGHDVGLHLPDDTVLAKKLPFGYIPWSACIRHQLILMPVSLPVNEPRYDCACSCCHRTSSKLGSLLFTRDTSILTVP